MLYGKSQLSGKDPAFSIDVLLTGARTLELFAPSSSGDVCETLVGNKDVI